LLDLFLKVVPFFHNLQIINIYILVFVIGVKITKVAAAFTYRPESKGREHFGRAEPRYLVAQGLFWCGCFDGKGICMRFDLKSHTSAA